MTLRDYLLLLGMALAFVGASTSEPPADQRAGRALVKRHARHDPVTGPRDHSYVR